MVYILYNHFYQKAGTQILWLSFAFLFQLIAFTNSAQTFHQENYNSDSIQYAIMLCTNVPNPAKPNKVYHKGETGHVFVRLQKLDHNENIIESIEWGFYPEKPVRSIFFKKTKSKLHNNHGKNYNASITYKISLNQYNQAIHKALELAQASYDLNHFNCYHYGIQIFNSVSASLQIPQRDIRFPYFLGKGGSPCALFSDLLAISNMPLSDKYELNFSSH